MFTLEIVDQLVLARPNRETFANSSIQFATEFGLVARQSCDNRGKRPEPAAHLSGAKSHAHQNERHRRPDQPAHQAGSELAKLLGIGAAKNHRMMTRPASAPASWATINIGTSAGAIPEELLVSARAIVTAGLAKDVEAVKPVGRRDVETDREGNRLSLEARHRENGDDQAKGGDKFGKPLRRAGTRLDRKLEQRQLEHAMRYQSPDAA